MNKEYYVTYNTHGSLKTQFYVLLYGGIDDERIGVTHVRSAASMFTQGEANEVRQYLIDERSRFTKNQRVVKSRRKEDFL